MDPHSSGRGWNSPMAHSQVSEAIANQILRHEINAFRFERFCLDLFSAIDGVQYSPTSVSWDLGIDGRTDETSRVGVDSVLCASLVSRVSDKAGNDIGRCLTSVSPKNLRFCSSQAMSEHARTGIEAELRRRFESIESLRLAGLEQIVAYSSSNPDTFLRWYGADVANIRDLLASGDGDSESDARAGLRVALTTQLDGDLSGLRRRTLEALILDSLEAGGGELSQNSLASAVSQRLHLGRAIAPAYLTEAVEVLATAGQVSREADLVVVTAEGKSAIEERAATGIETTTRGRSLLTQSMRATTGITLSPQDESSLWQIVSDNLAVLFFEQGIDITNAIGSLLRASGVERESKPLRDGIDEIASRIAGLFQGESGEILAQGFVDVSLDRESDWFKWMGDVAVAYVAMCSLGLEPKSQTEVRERVIRIRLILDTDVALSLLAESEPNHAVVSDLVKRWNEVGGQVLITRSVCEEVAYHAWISEVEMRQMFDQLLHLDGLEARQLLNNVFVRSFRRKAIDGEVKPRRKWWHQYVSAFRGKTERDPTNVLLELKDRGVFETQAEPLTSEGLKTWGKQINEQRLGASGLRSVERARRIADLSAVDAQLLYTIECQQSGESSDTGHPVLVSSSTLLRSVASLRRKPNSLDLVVPIGVVAFLVSLLPGVRFGLAGLQKTIYSPGFQEPLPPLERIALRVARQSDEYSVSYSSRRVLRRHLDTSIAKEAAQRGQAREKVERVAIEQNDEQQTVLTSVIAEALDAHQASQSEKRIRELERELAELRSRRR